MSWLETLTRNDIEEFLIEEAALLDEWRLTEWRALFDEECAYLVPSMTGDPYASPATTLYLIADDGFHLTERVKRLGKPTAHAEHPHSRTQRLVSNVRVLERNADFLRAQCGFVTYRAAQGVTDIYFGRHEYRLIERNGALCIKEKRTILGMEALRPQGRLSIIV
jgi:p-cumate 2,3-dioxygenase subunit beta